MSEEMKTCPYCKSEDIEFIKRVDCEPDNILPSRLIVDYFLCRNCKRTLYKIIFNGVSAEGGFMKGFRVRREEDHEEGKEEGNGYEKCKFCGKNSVKSLPLVGGYEVKICKSCYQCQEITSFSTEALKRQWEEEAKMKKIVPMPLPCVRVGDKDLKDCTDKEWFVKIGEELFEAVEARTMGRQYPALYGEDLAEELMDIITVCRSYLHAKGYDGEKLKALVELVNEKNRDRGRL